MDEGRFGCSSTRMLLLLFNGRNKRMPERYLSDGSYFRKNDRKRLIFGREGFLVLAHNNLFLYLFFLFMGSSLSFDATKFLFGVQSKVNVISFMG